MKADKGVRVIEYSTAALMRDDLENRVQALEKSL